MTTSPLLPSLLVWHDPDRDRSPAWHMALDEALLRHAREPVLRFYGWDRSAVTIGYFQEWVAEPGVENDRVVRRWTGGGRVEHGEDATFSLVLPADTDLAGLRVDDRYRLIHAALAKALEQAGLECALTPATAQGHRVDRCFVEPVEADVVLPQTGAKIAGGAQRRWQRAILHQGSVRTGWSDERIWQDHFSKLLSPTATSWTPDAELMQAAGELVASRYGHADWRRRPGQSSDAANE